MICMSSQHWYEILMGDKYLHKIRNKIQVYYDILNAIKLESSNWEGANPTRVQIHTNLAYDKLMRYLNELEMKEMILKDPLQITDKGQDFLQIYDRIGNESEVEMDQSSYLYATSRGGNKKAGGVLDPRITHAVSEQ